MKRCLAICIMAVVFTAAVFCGGSSEAGGSGSRGRYLAARGVVIPPEEVPVDSYISQIDYSYPEPEGDFGVTLYSSGTQLYSPAGTSAQGGEAVLQIGVQGAHKDFADLNPLNLAFVIDASASMADENKIDWVRSAFRLFIEKVRPSDFVSLIVFSDGPKVVFPATAMTDGAVRKKFITAVDEIIAAGDGDLRAGLEAGYEQVMKNFRSSYINRVLLLSDGTEFSSRLSREKGQSGEIRVTLMWNNRNDLDLHLIIPGGKEIYHNRRYAEGGTLDVDMNVHGESVKPVENIFWQKGSTPPSGEYRAVVRNYHIHESDPAPTRFQAELKIGDDIRHFEGTVTGTGYKSDVELFRFRYSPSETGKAEIYQLAGQYANLGINVSTIGVGTSFDLDLMTNLAKEGGGSSRFIADREKMEEIFGTGFARMVVPAVRNLRLKLAFDADVEILETWGYDHRIQGKTVTYTVPTLHLGDYETMLVRYRPKPGIPTGSRLLVRCTGEYTDLSGRSSSVPEKSLSVGIVNDGLPVSGYSNGMVLRSGTMMDLALGLKKIGELYYGPAGTGTDRVSERDRAAYRATVPPSDTALRQALDLSRSLLAWTENAALRLDSEAFQDEIGILRKYVKLFSEYLEPGGKADMPVAEALPTLRDGGSIETRVEHLIDEMILGFSGEDNPVVAVAGFSAPSGFSVSLNAFFDNALIAGFTGNKKFTVVERSQLDKVLKEQELSLALMTDTDEAIEIGRILSARYIVTGSLLETGRSVIVFARIVNVESGVVESAAQAVLSKDGDVKNYL